jgi:hypothetical protein
MYISVIRSLFTEQHGRIVVSDHESWLNPGSHIRSLLRFAMALMFARWSEPSFKAFSVLNTSPYKGGAVVCANSILKSTETHKIE